MSAYEAVAIRDVRADDMATVAAIYGDAVRNGRATFEIVPPDATEMARRMRELLESGHPYLVAERGDAVVGYAYAGPYRTRPAYLNTVESSVYVAPEARGSGIGGQLLAGIVARAEAAGFRQIVAAIGDAANAGSIAIHERCGFRHVGTLASVGRKHETWVDVVIMQRALGGGDRTPPLRETPGAGDSD